MRALCAAAVTLAVLAHAGGARAQSAPDTLGAPAVAAAHVVAGAIHPDVIHVGDIFHAIISVDLPPGGRAVFPDTLSTQEDLEPAGRVATQAEPLAGGGTRITASYPLTVWRPGPASLAPIRVRVLTDGGERVVLAEFPEFEVASVLPEDTTGIAPREAKDVIGGERVLWPWIVGLLMLLAAAGLVYQRWRERRPAAPVRTFEFDAGAAALAALRAERAEMLVRAGELRTLYIELADALRFFVAARVPALGRELTTWELRPIVARELPAGTDAPLLALLEQADMVKFAAAHAVAEQALHDWQRAREWVEQLEAARQPAAAEVAA